MTDWVLNSTSTLSSGLYSIVHVLLWMLVYVYIFVYVFKCTFLASPNFIAISMCFAVAVVVV